MKFPEVSFLLLCITATATWATTDCPKGPIYYHPSDCSKYLTCSHGNVAEMKCPAGLLFDRENGICNHAENVACQKKSCTSASVEDNFELAEICENKPHNGVCKIRCLAGFEPVDPNVPQEIKCVDGVWITPQLPCKQKEKPAEEVEAPDHKYCLKSRGQFPHPTDCKKYYDCWDEIVVIQKCPEGMLFDSKKVYCDHAENVKCVNNDKDNDQQKDDEEKEIPDKSYCLGQRGQYPHPTNCRKYYNCWDENVVISECPIGNVFDPALRHCVPSESTTCQVKKIVQKSSNGHQRVALLLSLQQTVQNFDDFDDDKYLKGVRIHGHKCPMNRGQFPHETDCRMFYNCWDQVVLLQKCPNKLLFDPVKLICDSPDRVNCKGRVIPGEKEVPGDKEGSVDNNNIDIHKGGNQCLGRADGVYETSECGYFIKCVAGKTYSFVCPANLAFDPLTKRCEYSHNVAKCKNKA